MKEEQIDGKLDINCKNKDEVKLVNDYLNNIFINNYFPQNNDELSKDELSKDKLSQHAETISKRVQRQE